MFIFKLVKYNNTILNPLEVKFFPDKIYGLSIKEGPGGGADGYPQFPKIRFLIGW